MELNKDKETQTAQVEPTKPEQAEQAPVSEPDAAPATKPTTPAEPDVQTSEEGGKTPPPIEPETGTEPAGEPEPAPETSSLTDRDLYMKLEDFATPIVTISMGKLGVASRLCGELFGSAMTFASAGDSSAPGQIGLDVVNAVLDSIAE